MVSVVRNKRTGHVYVNSETAAEKKRREDRERELGQQLHRDLEHGRLEWDRRMPIHYDKD